MTKEQEALEELKANGFTVIKNYSLKWGDEMYKLEKWEITYLMIMTILITGVILWQKVRQD